MSTNNSTRNFVNRYCFCNTELRTAIITKIKGLLIQTQQNMFLLFALFKLTLDERKTLTKILTCKTSHNRSPNQHTPWTTKKQGENPPLEGKQQVTEKSCLHGNPESSGPRMEANTEDIPPLVSSGDTISQEEEVILLDETPQPEDPAIGSCSPRSKTTTVSGGMAKLCLTSPSHPGPEEDETPP